MKTHIGEFFAPCSDAMLGAIAAKKDSPLTPALHAAMQALMDSPAYKATLEKWGMGSGAISTSQVLR